MQVLTVQHVLNYACQVISPHYDEFSPSKTSTSSSSTASLHSFVPLCVQYTELSGRDVMCCDAVGPDQPLVLNDLSVWQRFKDKSRATKGDPLLQFIFILIGNILCCSLLYINKPKPYSSFSKTH